MICLLSLPRFPHLHVVGKQSICIDIAHGLSALHRYGIIHGDLKPENILMFRVFEKWRAKVADFSHSLFDTGETCHLPGGTLSYAAPEWNQRMETSTLMRTDLWSFGILIGCVFVGYDFIKSYIYKDSTMTTEERMMRLEKMKHDNKLRSYILNLVYHVDEFDLEFSENDLSILEVWLTSTVEQDPLKRSLSPILDHSSRYNLGASLPRARY